MSRVGDMRWGNKLGRASTQSEDSATDHENGHLHWMDVEKHDEHVQNRQNMLVAYF